MGRTLAIGLLLVAAMAAPIIAEDPADAGSPEEIPEMGDTDIPEGEDMDIPEGEDDYDPAKHAKEEMEKMDTNKDGKATLEEIQAFVEKEFYTPEDKETMEASELKKTIEEDAKSFL